MRRKKWILAVLAVAVMAAAVAKAWFVEPIARIEPLKEVTDLSEEWIVKSGSLPRGKWSITTGFRRMIQRIWSLP